VPRCYFIPIQLLDVAQLPGLLAGLARDAEVETETRATVAGILEDVRRNGLEAVFRLTREFDGVELDERGFRVDPAAARAALAALRLDDPRLVEDLERCGTWTSPCRAAAGPGSGGCPCAPPVCTSQADARSIPRPWP
jgi:hypothetical protein